MNDYPTLDDRSYIKLQPDGKFFSAVVNGIRNEVGINGTANEILNLLTGEYQIEEIVQNLSTKHGEEKTKVDLIVKNFIQTLDTGKLVTYSHSPSYKPVKTKGSSQYYVPELVVLELTHQCPLKCKHCFLNAGIGPSMDKEKLMNVLYQFTELGVQCFQLTGGEPFAYPYIEDVIDFLLQNDIRIQITTSGFIFNKKVNRILDKIRNKGSLIQISLDGLEKSHNEIRGDERAYERAISFIKKCIEKKITVVVATCMIHQTIAEIEELSQYLRSLGVSLHRIGGVSNQGRAMENGISSGISFSQVNTFIDELKEKYETKEFKVGGFEDIDCTTEMNCGAGFRIIKLSPLFMVAPCPMMQLNIGNLNTEKIATIFTRNSKLFANLKRPFDTVCKDCGRLEDCKNCIAEAFNNKKDVEECYWYKEEFKIKEEQVYEPTTVTDSI